MRSSSMIVLIAALGAFTSASGAERHERPPANDFDPLKYVDMASFSGFNLASPRPCENSDPTIAILLSVLVTIPALAQEAAYVRLNEIRSTESANDRTLVVTNRQGDKYSVHMNGPCIGLSMTGAVPTFRPQSELACLKRGDRIGYNYPGQGLATSVRPVDDQEVCFIESVTAGEPE
jgi:hypothetical protein